MATTPAPQWSDTERATRIAFELSPALRQRCPTYERAMRNSAIAAALRIHGKAWLRRNTGPVA